MALNHLKGELIPFPPFQLQQEKVPRKGLCCCCVALVMSDSVQPHRQQPTRLPHPWDSPGKNTGVGCHFLLQYMKVESESEVGQSCLTLSNPWTAVHQAPLSMGFSRQKYWSGVPLPLRVKEESEKVDLKLDIQKPTS